MAPNTYNGYIFYKIDPLLIVILFTKLLKNLKSDHCGPISRSLFGHNGQQFGAQNDELVIFHKSDPPYIWILS